MYRDAFSLDKAHLERAQADKGLSGRPAARSSQPRRERTSAARLRSRQMLREPLAPPTPCGCLASIAPRTCEARPRPFGATTGSPQQAQRITDALRCPSRQHATPDTRPQRSPPGARPWSAQDGAHRSRSSSCLPLAFPACDVAASFAWALVSGHHTR